jgi:hypothetical protein
MPCHILVCPAVQAINRLPACPCVCPFHSAINHLYVYLSVYLSDYPYGRMAKPTAKEYRKNHAFSASPEGGRGWPRFGTGWHIPTCKSFENTPLPLQRVSKK